MPPQCPYRGVWGEEVTLCHCGVPIDRYRGEVTLCHCGIPIGGIGREVTLCHRGVPMGGGC